MSNNPFGSLPKFGRGSFAIFLAAAVLSAMLGDQPVANQLALQPSAVLSGDELWSPLTANFMFPNNELIGLLSTGFAQWFIGSQLEAFWGTKKYVTLVLGAGVAGYVASVVVGALSATAAGIEVGGSVPMDLAAITAFGFVFANRQLRLLASLPLSVKGFSALLVGLALVLPLFRGSPWPVVVPLAVAVAVAAAAVTQPWRRLRDSGKLRGSKKAKKRHLKVVGPDSKLLN
ncbi:MAG: hypothetical protein ACRBN8_10680 [Nannocystales bacterium]